MDLKDLGLKRINIDLSNDIVTRLWAKEGDMNSRGLLITLLDNGLEIDTTGISMMMYGKASNGEVYSRAVNDIDLSKGKYELIYPTNMLVAGVVKAELRLLKGEDVLSTKSFDIDVAKGILSDDIIAGEDEGMIIDRLLKAMENENERIEAEDIRLAKEEIRLMNEADRVSKETIRNASETERLDNENLRETKELQRIEDEGARIDSESQRLIDETTRIDMETERAAAEEGRDSSESTRNTSETTRKEEESIRIDNENTRFTNETTRLSKEDKRLTNEIERITNEDGRVIGETKRIDTEDDRVEQEGIRNQKFEDFEGSWTEWFEQVQNELSENDRIVAEEKRVISEDTRIVNEDSRMINEVARISLYDLVQSKLDKGELKGEDIQFNWRGTELGIKSEKETNYEYIDLKGETGEVENLNEGHILEALGFIPLNYKAGENITITDGTINAEGEELSKLSIETALGHSVDKSVPSDANFKNTIYKHPASHSADIVVENKDKRFVSDVEKIKWNKTEEDLDSHKADKAIHGKIGTKEVDETELRDEAILTYSANDNKWVAAIPTLDTWSEVRDVVRRGLANKYFAVGDQLSCNYDGSPITMEVIGIDVETPTDSQYTHSMTLQTQDCLHDIQFDSEEPTNPDSSRKSYGNNRYAHSAVKQWLNSDESLFNWESQHSHDAKPDDSLDLYGGAGFLNKLDPELSAVLGVVDKNVAKADVDGGGQENFNNKVFLLSRVEAGLGSEGDTTGEQVYPFYDGVANAGRIKELNGSLRNWWLRSPGVGISSHVRYVPTSGSLGNISARSTYGLSPACVII